MGKLVRHRQPKGPATARLPLSHRVTSRLYRLTGSGDLIFRSVTVLTRASGSNGITTSKTTHFGFLAIPEVGDVEKLVRETLIDRFVDNLNRASAL